MIGWAVVVGAFCAESHWFDSTSSRHVGTLGKSFTHYCLYDVMWCPVAALQVAKIDSCNSLSSVHTLLVNIRRCVRLYIKRKYYYIKILLRYYYILLSTSLSFYLFFIHVFSMIDLWRRTYYLSLPEFLVGYTVEWTLSMLQMRFPFFHSSIHRMNEWIDKRRGWRWLVLRNKTMTLICA